MRAEHPGRPVAHPSCPGVRHSDSGDEGWGLGTYWGGGCDGEVGRLTMD